MAEQAEAALTTVPANRGVLRGGGGNLWAATAFPDGPGCQGNRGFPYLTLPKQPAAAPRASPYGDALTRRPRAEGGNRCAVGNKIGRLKEWTMDGRI